jgi:hypothetical protein
LLLNKQKKEKTPLWSTVKGQDAPSGVSGNGTRVIRGPLERNSTNTIADHNHAKEAPEAFGGDTRVVRRNAGRASARR